MPKRYLLALLVALVCLPAHAAEPWHGKITKFADADTFFVKLDGGKEIKIRLRYADAPELARTKREDNQPGGVEAKNWAEKRWLGDRVTIKRTGTSYGRVVAHIETTETKSIGLELVASGNARLDPRYRPPKAWLEAQAEAKRKKRGLWREPNPIPPWEWRKQQREKRGSR